MGGDFNTVKEVYEKNGGRDLLIYDHPQLESFHDCLQFCHLFDMRATRHIWSWSKKSVESRRIVVRLRLSWKGASGWIGLTLQDQGFLFIKSRNSTSCTESNKEESYNTFFSLLICYNLQGRQGEELISYYLLYL